MKMLKLFQKKKPKESGVPSLKKSDDTDLLSSAAGLQGNGTSTNDAGLQSDGSLQKDAWLESDGSL